MLLRDPDYTSPIPNPDSPPTTPPLPPQHPPNDLFDDVFFTSHSTSSDQLTTENANPISEPSDIPRLQQQHTTAGYREGLAVARAASAQAGFDEGFSLGGTIGAKAGRLLGVLEAIAAAVPENSELQKLLNEAKAELSGQRLLGSEFWEVDGTWKYEVPGGDGDGDGDCNVLFEHVADAHPVLKRWTAVVEEEMRRWGVVEGTFKEDDRGREKEDGPVPRIIQLGARSEDAMSW